MKSYELFPIDKITRSFFVYCFTRERVEKDGNERIALKVETKRNERYIDIYSACDIGHPRVVDLLYSSSISQVYLSFPR